MWLPIWTVVLRIIFGSFGAVVVVLASMTATIAADPDVSYQDTINYIRSNTQTHTTNFAGGFIFDDLHFNGCNVEASGHGTSNSDIVSEWAFDLSNAAGTLSDENAMVTILFSEAIANNTLTYPRGRPPPHATKADHFWYVTDDVEISRRLANAWSHAIKLCKATSSSPSDSLK